MPTNVDGNLAGREATERETGEMGDSSEAQGTGAEGTQIDPAEASQDAVMDDSGTESAQDNTDQVSSESPNEEGEQTETHGEETPGAGDGALPVADEAQPAAQTDEEAAAAVGPKAAVAGATLASGAAAGEAEKPEGVESGSRPEGGEQAEQPADETAPAAQADEAGLAGTAAVAATAKAAATPEPDLLQEDKRRRRLLLTLLLLTVLLASAGIVFWRYLKQPAPLPDLLPLPGSVNYAPHYLFSIYGIEKPVGVALSPQGDRIYASETSGARLVRVFDRDGNPLGSFAPPRTEPAERSPVYLAVDATGRVYVSDRLQHAVFVYDAEGNYEDMILGPALTLSEYVSSHAGGLPVGVRPEYNRFEQIVHYQTSGGDEQTLPAPDPSDWAPLGVRLDGAGNLLLTDVLAERHAVLEIPGETLSSASWQTFDPSIVTFGSYGQSNDQFMFPNSAVLDSLNRVHVTDGNNGRVSVWDKQGEFLFSFGQGTGEGALGLPRGAIIDNRERLHVVDTVEQSVKVYEVSGTEPEFLFAFGDWGTGDGEFNFPGDIALDTTGRLYIADRENDRIQVWSY